MNMNDNIVHFGIHYLFQIHECICPLKIIGFLSLLIPLLYIRACLNAFKSTRYELLENVYFLLFSVLLIRQKHITSPHRPDRPMLKIRVIRVFTLTLHKKSLDQNIDIQGSTLFLESIPFTSKELILKT